MVGERAVRKAQIIARFHRRRLAADPLFRELPLTVLLVVEALGVFAVQPLLAMRLLPAYAQNFVEVAIVIVALGVTATHRRAQGVILVSALVDFVSFLLRQIEPSAVTLGIDLATRVIFLSALSVVLLHIVFGNESEGTYHRIQGGIAVYLNIAVIFALLFRLATIVDPHAFSSGMYVTNAPLSQCIYFSFGTLTTTGYGDIVPINPLVRSVANLESVIGTLYPATLLARLVVRYFT